jgi:hypothetical protein
MKLAVMKNCTSATFSPNGKLLVTVTSMTRVTASIWEVATGLELFVLRGHENVVRLAIFSPCGSKVLTASDDETARLWDVGTGSELFVLRGHENVIRFATFSPCGSKVLTASDDKTSRLWDVNTGIELLVLRGHEDSVRSAMFSPDGARVVTRDARYRLWDVTNGVELANTFVCRGVLVDNLDCMLLETNARQILCRWSDGSQIEENDPPVEDPFVPTLLCTKRGIRWSLRIRGITGFVPPWIHLDIPAASQRVTKVLPNDPLSFVAGCADGSVRFFRLEGVDLPDIR